MVSISTKIEKEIVLLQLSPYPSDKEMQKELQAAIDWEAFKNTTFKSTLKHLGRAKDATKNY